MLAPLSMFDSFEDLVRTGILLWWYLLLGKGQDQGHRSPTALPDLRTQDQPGPPSHLSAEPGSLCSLRRPWELPGFACPRPSALLPHGK